MTTLREAAQQALEALEMHVPQYLKDRGYRPITALRAALAEPVQEPVAWSYELATTMLEHGYDGWEYRITRYKPNVPEGSIRNLTPLYTAPPQRPAEPVQEPVAWIHTDPDKRRVKFLEWRENEPGYRGDWIKTPLYTAPPQRKPLTEEEIRDLWSWAMTAEAERTATTQQHAFARAIEAKHGIGVDE